jgi:hypothetical protein
MNYDGYWPYPAPDTMRPQNYYGFWNKRDKVSAPQEQQTEQTHQNARRSVGEEIFLAEVETPKTEAPPFGHHAMEAAANSQTAAAQNAVAQIVSQVGTSAEAPLIAQKAQKASSAEKAQSMTPRATEFSRRIRMFPKVLEE